MNAFFLVFCRIDMNKTFIDFLVRFPTSFGSRIRILGMRICGARIGGKCRFESIRWRQADQIEIGGYVSLTHGTVLYPGLRNPERPGKKIVIHNRVFINAYCFIDAGERVEIESGVMIGPYCYITDGDHGTSGQGGVMDRPMRYAPVRIQEGAWLGAHVSVLRGVNIGKNAVIGAGAVVTKDVPDGATYGGVPARPLAKRKPDLG
jgi:maltose O-acetyltransferase